MKTGSWSIPKNNSFEIQVNLATNWPPLDLLNMLYSKHPRIRTYIFASQPELVLIFWVFSKKSGCLGS